MDSMYFFFNSWYVGMMSRDEAKAVLDAERDSGVFLVRDSTTIKGDFVLCVK
jgi:C-crk adapter molecule crk